MAYPFAAAEVLTAVDLNAMIGAPTQNTQTGTTYTAVLLDAGKTVTLSNASAVTLTIPAQASVSWADNTQLNFLNLGAGTVTITPAADVTINGEPLTLETSKGGSLVRTASNTWTFIPFSGGVEAANANFTNTATGTYTEDGIDYKYITFTGSGSLVVDQAGFADVLVVAGGGGAGNATNGVGNGGGGGAGGLIYATSFYIASAATFTATVGTGGANNVEGNPSNIFSITCVGGGYGGNNGRAALRGGSGGGGFGGGGGSSAGGAGTVGQGNLGPGGGSGGGGGGSSAAGASTSGGAGTSVSITGAAVTYAAGGNAGSSANGAANTGNGAGGGGFTGQTASGGSGIIIVRVVV